MAGTSPIQLGSAVSGWTFEAASSVEESASGIQTCMVQALWPIGSTVLSNLPAAGSSVSGITSYIPSDFLLDYTESGPDINYIEGTVARVKFKFKRQDPSRTGSVASRLVTTDTILNFKTGFPPLQLLPAANGTFEDPAPKGFPEPLVTVVYNSSSEPSLARGLYALPGSAEASGFPPVITISQPYTIYLPIGGSLYFGTQIYGPVLALTRFDFQILYTGDPAGWQLTKFKYTPVANRAFFDVEEQWRNSYYYSATNLVNVTPFIAPH